MGLLASLGHEVGFGVHILECSHEAVPEFRAADVFGSSSLCKIVV